MSILTSSSFLEKLDFPCGQNPLPFCAQSLGIVLTRVRTTCLSTLACSGSSDWPGITGVKSRLFLRKQGDTKKPITDGRLIAVMLRLQSATAQLLPTNFRASRWPKSSSSSILNRNSLQASPHLQKVQCRGLEQPTRRSNQDAVDQLSGRPNPKARTVFNGLLVFQQPLWKSQSVQRKYILRLPCVSLSESSWSSHLLYQT